jgi:hypothetical protein
MTTKVTLSHIALSLALLVTQACRAGVVISFDGVRHHEGLGDFDQVTYTSVRVIDANEQWLLDKPGMIICPNVQLSPNSKRIAVLMDGILSVYTNDARIIQRLHHNDSLHTFELKHASGVNYWQQNKQSPRFRWVSDSELVIVTEEAGSKNNFQCRLLVSLELAKAISCHSGFVEAALWRDGTEVPMLNVDNDFMSSILLSRIASFRPTGWSAFFWDHTDKEYMDMWFSKNTQQMRALKLDQVIK